MDCTDFLSAVVIPASDHTLELPLPEKGIATVGCIGFQQTRTLLLPAFERPLRTPAAAAPVEFTACKSAGLGQRVIAAPVCGGCGSRSR
jgi:hypothetical protein